MFIPTSHAVCSAFLDETHVELCESFQDEVPQLGNFTSTWFFSLYRFSPYTHTARYTKRYHMLVITFSRPTFSSLTLFYSQRKKRKKTVWFRFLYRFECQLRGRLTKVSIWYIAILIDAHPLYRCLLFILQNESNQQNRRAQAFQGFDGRCYAANVQLSTRRYPPDPPTHPEKG